jgi:hypothetical protein
MGLSTKSRIQQTFSIKDKTVNTFGEWDSPGLCICKAGTLLLEVHLQPIKIVNILYFTITQAKSNVLYKKIKLGVVVYICNPSYSGG